MGDIDGAIRGAEEQLRSALKMRLPYGVEDAVASIAGKYIARGDLQRAEPMLGEHADSVAWTVQLLRATIALLGGDTERAVTLLPSSDLMRSLHGQYIAVEAARAEILWQCGRADEARAAADAIGIADAHRGVAGLSGLALARATTRPRGQGWGSAVRALR